jgi:PAS domain S-box-containing protein
VTAMQRMPNLLVVVTVCLLLSPSALASQVKQTRRVLMLSELGPSSPTVALIEQEIRTAALDEKFPSQVEFYSEYLETTLFGDEASQNNLRDWFIRKYQSRKPELIIAAGPSPIQFLAKVHETFFRDTPIVFCASSEEEADYPKLDSQFTGVWMTIEAARTLEAAIRLQPGTRRVVVVGGVAPFDRRVENIVRENLRSYETKMEFTYLTDLDILTLCERIKHLPKDAVILYTTISEDSAGKHFLNVRQSAPMVVQAANVPIYALVDVFVGLGFVGGYVSSYAEQGQVAAGIAAKILGGTKPQEIPIVRGTNVYMFDARALRRWGLNENMLPRRSAVLYREPTLAERYKGEIFGILLIFGTLVVLSGYLLIERRRLALAEKELEAEVQFERLISELSNHFIDLPAIRVDAGIDQALIRLANYLAIDRVSIFEFTIDKKELVLTHSGAPTRGTSTPAPQRYATSELPWYAGKVLNSEPVVFTSIDQLPDHSEKDKAFLRSRGVQSNVTIPLEAEGSVLGCLSFVTVYESRIWSSRLVDQVKILGQVFANALVRKRSDEALVTSEMLKGAILSSISTGLAVVNERGEIVAVNSRWKEFSSIYAWTDMKLEVGTNFLEAWQLASRTPRAAQVLSGIKVVLQGKSNYFETEYPFAVADNQRWFSMRVTPLQASNGGAVISFNDITDRKLAEEKLRESEERFRVMADTAPVMVWRSGIDMQCDFFNKPWLEFTGRPLEREVKNGWLEGVHSEDLQNCLDTYVSNFKSRQPFTMEYRLRRADGEYRWVLDKGVPRYSPTGEFVGFIGSCIDITERKLAEQEREELAGRLINAQEQERSRLARELHDDFNQRLAVLAIDLERCANLASHSPAQASERMLELWNRASEIGADLHTLSHQLHSSTLQSLGLILGVGAFCDEFAQQQGIQVDVAHENIPRSVPPDVALCLFRIVQEGLRNVKKHSGSSRAEVRLEGSDDAIHLSLFDHGVGFDRHHPSTQIGLGMRSMEERLRLIGGRFELQSAPMKGTRIDVWVPLKPAIGRAS